MSGSIGARAPRSPPAPQFPSSSASENLPQFRVVQEPSRLYTYLNYVKCLPKLAHMRLDRRLLLQPWTRRYQRYMSRAGGAVKRALPRSSTGGHSARLRRMRSCGKLMWFRHTRAIPRHPTPEMCVVLGPRFGAVWPTVVLCAREAVLTVSICEKRARHLVCVATFGPWYVNSARVCDPTQIGCTRRLCATKWRNREL